MAENLKHRAVSAATWHMAEMLTARFGQFIVGIVLARILLPEQFGLIATLLVFLQLASVFVSGGFGQALIQRKKTTILEESSVFFGNVTVAGMLYGVLFFTAPLVASFYENPILVPINANRLTRTGRKMTCCVWGRCGIAKNGGIQYT